ncbi:MAG TPA: hypothetical protein VGT41_02045 [Candidatus Babeliales bacterium]|nr:hypothetical protein [Candidatus Babeliales bacterium]
MLIKRIIIQCALIALVTTHTTTYPTEVDYAYCCYHDEHDAIPQLESLDDMIDIIAHLIDMHRMWTLEISPDDDLCKQYRAPKRTVPRDTTHMRLDTLDDITVPMIDYDYLFINNYGTEMCWIKRVHAMNQMLTYQHPQLPQSYELPATVHYLLSKNNIPAHYFTNCLGNPIQMQLHEELLEMLNQTAALHETYSWHPSINNFTKTIITFFDISNTYNNVGYVDRAKTINDFCWVLLEYGKAIIAGTLSGVIKSHCNPIPATETTKSLNHCASQVGHYMSKMIDELCNIPIQYCVNPAQGKALYQEFIHKIMVLYAIVKQKFEESSTLEITEQTASFIAQAYMTIHQLKTTRSKLTAHDEHRSEQNIDFLDSNFYA